MARTGPQPLALQQESPPKDKPTFMIDQSTIKIISDQYSNRANREILTKQAV